MDRRDYLFTSESVSEGHPDKVCDRISDAIVDLYLDADPASRVAVETLVTTNRIVMAGEVRGPGSITHDDLERVARDCVRDIGYEQDGFHWRNAGVYVYVHAQSSDIAQGVDAAGNKDEGAGDQGIMFGYACSETDDLMPAPIHYAHSILRAIAEARHSGAESGFGPRRQEPGHAAIRRRSAGAGHVGRGVDPASRRALPGRRARPGAALRGGGAARRLDVR